MALVYGTNINHLLATTDLTGLLFTRWMKENGYSEQLQKTYRDSGWLTSLSQGVMYRTGSKLSAFSALASSNKQMGTQLRIAAHSALEYNGFNHYVPMGKPVLAVSTYPLKKRPLWMKDDMFDVVFRPFYTEVFSAPEVINVTTETGTLLVSSPEQAFLECLLLAPKYYNYMDLYYIMEQLTTLRSEVVQRLLESTSNVSIKRMFLYMAEKANHYWFEELNLEKIKLGTSKIQLVSKGTYIPKYKITVPNALNSYEG